MSKTGDTNDTSRRRDALASFYGPLEDSDNPARRVGWESASAQRLRLHSLISTFDVTTVGTILDAGCGEAALFDLLENQGFSGRYRGEDLREAPIARARTRIGRRETVELIVADAFGGGPQAEVVVCSGALNTDTGAPHQAEVEAAIAALFSRAELMLVLDLAVSDRHHPGVGLAGVDIAALYGFCRGLSPICAIHEDVVPGEAMIVLSKSRAQTYRRRVRDPLLVAENLLLAGEPERALALLQDGEDAFHADTNPATTPEAHLVIGRALVALGQHKAAMDALTRATSGAPTTARAARLAMAPLLWRANKKREAEELLVELAGHDDEARAHLFELYLARGQHQEATALIPRIGDLWMRRELQRILDSAKA